mmetsp:Transcript_11802/g.16339  ORF Transcript_11802/g.16339 Transcript_11802/m.16339 type:complete len:312 (+) Transcript_11802:2-937(+)
MSLSLVTAARRSHLLLRGNNQSRVVAAWNVRGFKRKPRDIRVENVLDEIETGEDGKLTPMRTDYKLGTPLEELPTTIFAYPTCPHCNKVFAYLDYLQHEYTLVHVNPITKAEIKWSTDYKKVPIATMAEKEIFGSDEIIFAVHEEWQQFHKIADGLSKEDFYHWNTFVDEEIARPLFVATSSTWEDALKYTAYVREMEKYPGYLRWLHHMVATFFTRVGSNKTKKKFNLSEPLVALEDAMKRFLGTFEGDTTGPFHGGEKPSFADILVFGTFRSVGGFDAVAQLRDRNPEINTWFTAMENAVGAPAVVEKL